MKGTQCRGKHMMPHAPRSQSELEHPTDKGPLAGPWINRTPLISEPISCQRSVHIPARLCTRIKFQAAKLAKVNCTDIVHFGGWLCCAALELPVLTHHCHIKCGKKQPSNMFGWRWDGLKIYLPRCCGCGSGGLVASYVCEIRLLWLKCLQALCLAWGARRLGLCISNLRQRGSWKASSE